jgi:hypothetical protein
MQVEKQQGSLSLALSLLSNKKRNYSVIKCNGTQMTRMIMMNADNREAASL